MGVCIMSKLAAIQESKDIQVILDSQDIIEFKYDFFKLNFLDEKKYNDATLKFSKEVPLQNIIKVVRAYVIAEKRFFKLKIFNEVYDVKIVMDSTDRNIATILMSKKINSKNNIDFSDMHKLKLLSLGEMTAGIIHDIKNPINACLSSIEVAKFDLDDLIEDSDNEEFKEELLEVKEKMNFFEEGASRVNDIIEGISLLSRKEQPDFQSFELNEFMKKTTSFLKYELDKNGVSLDLKLKNNFQVKGKESLLAQVVTNIVKNGIDAVSDQPYNKRWIEIHDEQDRENFIIKIKDSGKGIPDHIKNKILEPFFTTKELGKGTGLGLSLSKQIMEMHEGSLSIDNSKETTFILKIKKNI